MRKLIYSINLTIDGCCDHTQVGPPHDELYDYYIRLMHETDALIYGRKTYQLMVPYWPDIAKSNSVDAEKDMEFAKAFVDVKKIIVFSKTLEKEEENNTKIVRTNPSARNTKIKTGTRKKYSNRWCRHSFATHPTWPR